MCKICGNETQEIIINNLKYHFCPTCFFLAKDEKYVLTKECEKGRYLLHHNDSNAEYYKYQTSFMQSINAFLTNNILDFGCGDNHILATILASNNYNVSFYDKYFYPDKKVLYMKYKTIILEEVIEHLLDPISILSFLEKILDDNGCFIIRTKLFFADTDLKKWWYLRDNTHFSFFREKTFSVICNLLSLKIIYSNGNDIIILKKVMTV